MTRTIRAEALTAEAFAPFGEAIAAEGAADRIINRGWCERFHDRADLDFGGGRAGVSLFRAKPRALPYTLDLLERHPLGSQTFIPMAMAPFLVIVAPDAAGRPGAPRAFLTEAGQAISYRRGVWHGVLTPLSEPGLFAVVDRIGPEPNLEEVALDPPWIVEAEPTG